MSQLPIRAPQWLVRVALAATCAAVTGLAWVGYGASDSQTALAALWSLCAPAR